MPIFYLSILGKAKHDDYIYVHLFHELWQCTWAGVKLSVTERAHLFSPFSPNSSHLNSVAQILDVTSDSSFFLIICWTLQQLKNLQKSKCINAVSFSESRVKIATENGSKPNAPSVIYPELETWEFVTYLSAKSDWLCSISSTRLYSFYIPGISGSFS